MLKQESKIKWEQFLSGNREAYSWIYKTYVQQLYQYGLRFTTDSELVKDTIQEVFTHIYKNSKRLITPENVKLYLMASLKNSLIRALQKESAYKYKDLSAVGFSMEPTVEEEFILNEQYAAQQEQISKIFALLSSRQQEVIYYRFIQELDLNEIALLMDMNYQSVQNLIQRSLKKIRDTFGYLIF
jgi:RNA polymerase sigma factor (sigma-70 family)